MSTDQPALHVGDHVHDIEDPEGARMLVIALPTGDASKFDIAGPGETVADYNPGYPPGDDVVEVVYPQRAARELNTDARYAFPRSRLERAHPIHHTEDDTKDDTGVVA